MKKRIILSRTDKIGDVILTLPMAGILKKEFSGCEVLFLGARYTKPIIDTCINIDAFIDWTELSELDEDRQIEAFREYKADTIIHVFPNKRIAKLAKQSKIPLRVGTSHRLYNLLWCNRPINLSRKKSNLHEAQLNIKLLKPLEILTDYTIDQISSLYGLNKIEKLEDKYGTLLSKDKINLIMHPKSKGSAREWGLNNYENLLSVLPAEKYKLFITGSEDEGKLMNEFLDKNHDKLVDLTGKLTLAQLISFIDKADALIAASTGPLHIASALGKMAIGLYPPIRPMHPGRWGCIGQDTHILVKQTECSKCRKMNRCECIEGITPCDVKTILENYTK